MCSRSASQTAEASALLDRAIAAAADVDPDLLARCSIDRVWVLWGHEDTGRRFAAELQALEIADEPKTLLEQASSP